MASSARSRFTFAVRWTVAVPSTVSRPASAGSVAQPSRPPTRSARHHRSDPVLAQRHLVVGAEDAGVEVASDLREVALDRREARQGRVEVERRGVAVDRSRAPDLDRLGERLGEQRRQPSARNPRLHRGVPGQGERGQPVRGGGAPAQDLVGGETGRPVGGSAPHTAPARSATASATSASVRGRLMRRYIPSFRGGFTQLDPGRGRRRVRAAGEAQSAYLVRAGDVALCLDLGAGALNRLQAEIAPERLSAIVISHLHPDHCADLFSLRVYMSWDRDWAIACGSSARRDSGIGSRRSRGPTAGTTRSRSKRFADHPAGSKSAACGSAGRRFRILRRRSPSGRCRRRVGDLRGRLCPQRGARPARRRHAAAGRRMLARCRAAPAGADPPLGTRGGGRSRPAPGRGGCSSRTATPSTIATPPSPSPGRASPVGSAGPVRVRRWTYPHPEEARCAPLTPGAGGHPELRHPRPRARLPRPVRAGAHLVRRAGGRRADRRGRVRRSVDRAADGAALATCSALDAVIVANRANPRR